MHKSLILLIAVWNILCLPAFGDSREQNFLKFKAALQDGKGSINDDKLSKYLFYENTDYVSKDQFCAFLILPVVHDKVEQSINTFSPRNSSWFLNLYKKISQCQTASASQFNTWMRKLEFNILLFGEKAKKSYLAQMKAEPAEALKYQLHYARLFLNDGDSQGFENQINQIISAKKENTDTNFNVTNWAHIFLANLKINRGVFAEAGNHLKLVSKEALKKDPVMEQEYNIVEFQKQMAENRKTGSKTKLTLPEFCQAKSDSFMRYRELEICLVGDVLINQKTQSPYLAELEPLLTKLLPVQYAQVALTLLAISERGVFLDPKIQWRLQKLRLETAEQTSLRYIFDYSRMKMTKAKMTSANDPALKVLGPYSIHGLIVTK